MKLSLPILPAVALGVLIAIGGGLLVARHRAAAPPAASAPPAAPQTAPPIVPTRAASTPTEPAPPIEAGLLLAQAARQLASHDSVTAKVNLTSDFFGESLVATGQYLQGSRDSRRLRMDLKVQLGEKVCTLQHVCDGQAVWIRRTTLTQTFLGRVDLPRALAGLQQAGYQPGTDVLALGGLPLLLDSLGRAVDFRAMRSEQLRRQPTFVIVGAWKNSLLVHFAPDQKQAIESGVPADLTRLPALVPNQIEVFIGRDDLFPYKIEFLHVAVPGTCRDEEVLASVKFNEVHFDIPIDAREFAFPTGDIVPIDETQAFIDRAKVR